MTIFDVFSWLPRHEMDIEELIEIFKKSSEGIIDDVYKVLYDLPDNVGDNIVEAKTELISEGKKVAYIKREDAVIALIGYK